MNSQLLTIFTERGMLNEENFNNWQHKLTEYQKQSFQEALKYKTKIENEQGLMQKEDKKIIPIDLLNKIEDFNWRKNNIDNMPTKTSISTTH